MNSINLTVKRGEHIAITGSSGSGKTTLGRLLTGLSEPTSGHIYTAPGLSAIMVEQQDGFIALSGQRSAWYGSRYENQDMDTVPTVGEYLARFSNERSALSRMMCQLGIEHIADSHLMQLSNGERKRTQLASAMLQQPDVLLLDQPFVGLDAVVRLSLARLLASLADTTLIIICAPDEIPACIPRTLTLEQGRLTSASQPHPCHKPPSPPLPKQFPLPRLHPPEKFNVIVDLKNVCVTYSGKPVLKNITWRVNEGEQWALLGPNGSGKTTLLSLITADNPQGYTNELTLFDRRRGTGESIWDIKRRIGFVSPELHQYFLRGAGIYNTIPGLRGKKMPARYDSLSCRDVVVSGFRDETGFASPASKTELQTATEWMAILGLNHLCNRLFVHASMGEQRTLLLARALAKSPALFILDEPCQGLDRQQTSAFVSLLDAICRNMHTTLIYVTHRPDEIPPCITRIMRLENGTMVS